MNENEKKLVKRVVNNSITMEMELFSNLMEVNNILEDNNIETGFTNKEVFEVYDKVREICFKLFKVSENL